ncbi:MAG: YqgE/AlgH family protein [Nitrospinaceae bacterium]|nr:MAG: YqgE/AlgH family protein [Nitrospinaceae bacterium]
MNYSAYGKGSFLIANPVLPDPNFSRTVVLLCNHDDEGSFGLVINKPADVPAAEIFRQIDLLDSYDNKVFVGGPVAPSQLFYLCRSENPIPDLDRVCDGVYLGMSWEALETALPHIPDPERNLRFYLGYSGWAAGQLAGEMGQRSWLTCDAKRAFVFETDEASIWARTVKSMGKDYEYLLNAPVNPQWN